MPLLQMIDIVKTFPGVVANDHVNLTIEAGEIHALLGENGAGKSTLMKILSGSYAPDSGSILIHDKPVTIQSPRDALRQHIGMIYQHFMLVEPMTVLENILLGLDGADFVPRKTELKQELTELASRFDLQVDLDAYIWQLSVGEQQRVEILRLLHRSADLIILDEPTAVLTPQETHQLAAALRQMTEQGKAAIIITHKLAEVMEFSDRVTVLRKGRNVATLVTKDTQPLELTRLMLGHEVESIPRPERTVSDEVAFEVQDLSAPGDRGLPALEHISFTIRRGEILGIAGVAGNGQRELAEVLTGVRKASSGRILLDGQDVTYHSPGARIAGGLGYIPEDRLRVGSVAGLSVRDNAVLKKYKQPPLSRGPLLSFRAMRSYAQHLVEQFGVSTPDVDVTIGTLSGDNIQKVILGREMSAQPRVIVASHPTRGLDVGAAQAIHRRLIAHLDSGTAVLLISEDLDELLALSNRIAVMYKGQIVGVVDAHTANLDEIGLMMAGGLSTGEQA